MSAELRRAIEGAIRELERGDGRQKGLREVLHLARQDTVDRARDEVVLQDPSLGVAFFLYLYLTNLFYNVAGDVPLDEESGKVLHNFYVHELSPVLRGFLAMMEGRGTTGDVLPFVDAARVYIQVIANLRAHFSLKGADNDLD